MARSAHGFDQENGQWLLTPPQFAASIEGEGSEVGHVSRISISWWILARWFCGLEMEMGALERWMSLGRLDNGCKYPPMRMSSLGHNGQAVCRS